MMMVKGQLRVADSLSRMPSTKTRKNESVVLNVILRIYRYLIALRLMWQKVLGERSTSPDSTGNGCWGTTNTKPRLWHVVVCAVGEICGHSSVFPYEECWNEELTNARLTGKGTMLHGFVDYDNTPRRGKKGRVVLGATPEKFERYMSELLKIAREKDSPYVFISAWNEWGENSCLEPDTIHGYAYLEALKQAIDQQAE